MTKRVVYDRETNKNYIVKEEREEIPASEELVKRINGLMREASNLIPRPIGSQPIGFVVSFCFERSATDKFDYQSASIVDLERVNVKASDMMMKDLTLKVARAYGHADPLVRQDAPAINE